MPEILRALRTDKDMSQKEVGVALGISQQQYSQYETGQIDLPLRYLRKLIDLFDVSADYLLGRTQRPENKSFRNVQVTKDCSCAALLNASSRFPRRTARRRWNTCACCGSRSGRRNV